MHLFGVNDLAVLVAAVVQWVLGWIWYGMLFKKDWTALVVKDSAKSSNAGGVMALIFITNLILSFALAQIYRPDARPRHSGVVLLWAQYADADSSFRPCLRSTSARGSRSSYSASMPFTGSSPCISAAAFSPSGANAPSAIPVAGHRRVQVAYSSRDPQRLSSLHQLFVTGVGPSATRHGARLSAIKLQGCYVRIPHAGIDRQSAGSAGINTGGVCG